MPVFHAPKRAFMTTYATENWTWFNTEKWTAEFVLPIELIIYHRGPVPGGQGSSTISVGGTEHKTPSDFSELF